jgi:hypothetical protein
VFRVEGTGGGAVSPRGASSCPLRRGADSKTRCVGGGDGKYLARTCAPASVESVPTAASTASAVKGVVTVRRREDGMSSDRACFVGVRGSGESCRGDDRIQY